MSNHADYCPIAVGVDILGDRWTPLVIRELMIGSSGFNEIHRGIPKMSRTLLSQRLRTMERRGLVQRQSAERGRQGRYELTPSGEALTPIVWALGHWAAEWQFGDPTDDDCDAYSLMWRMHQFAVPSKLPTNRTVVQLTLTGSGAGQGWLVINKPAVTVCRDDPGYDVDLVLEADTAQLARWVIGLVPFADLTRAGHARLVGPSRLSRAFPAWFDNATFAEGFRRSRERRERAAALV